MKCPRCNCQEMKLLWAPFGKCVGCSLRYNFKIFKWENHKDEYINPREPLPC